MEFREMCDCRTVLLNQDNDSTIDGTQSLGLMWCDECQQEPACDYCSRGANTLPSRASAQLEGWDAEPFRTSGAARKQRRRVLALARAELQQRVTPVANEPCATSVNNTSARAVFDQACEKRAMWPAAPLNVTPVAGITSAAELLGWSGKEVGPKASNKTWMFSTCNGTCWSQIQVFIDTAVSAAGQKPDFYAVQEHRMCDADERSRKEAAAKLRMLKMSLGPALKTGEHKLATSAGTGTAVKTHIGRRKLPQLDVIIEDIVGVKTSCWDVNA